MPKRSASNLPSAQAEDYSSSNPHLGLLHSMLKKKTRVHVHTCNSSPLSVQFKSPPCKTQQILSLRKFTLQRCISLVSTYRYNPQVPASSSLRNRC